MRGLLVEFSLVNDTSKRCAMASPIDAPVRTVEFTFGKLMA